MLESICTCNTPHPRLCLPRYEIIMKSTHFTGFWGLESFPKGKKHHQCGNTLFWILVTLGLSSTSPSLLSGSSRRVYEYFFGGTRMPLRAFPHSATPRELGWGDIGVLSHFLAENLGRRGCIHGELPRSQGPQKWTKEWKQGGRWREGWRKGRKGKESQNRPKSSRELGHAKASIQGHTPGRESC